MALEEKNKIELLPDQKEKKSNFTPPPLTRIPSHLRDDDQAREDLAWEQALTNICELAKERKLVKKVFLSYAWPPAGLERDELQYWLKKLQDDLQKAGIQVFYDLRDMQGHLDTTMEIHLNNSNFVLPILTPKFLERAQDPSTNLAFEFRQTLEKAKHTPASIIPILFSGSFGEVVKGPLAPLMKHLIYGGLRLEPLLTSLSDPLGLIPVIYGFRIGDKPYEAILQKWRNNSLTRIPDVVPDFINRITLTKKLQEGFQQQQESKLSPIQIIQGIGGTGKTQLATWFANHCVPHEGFVRWIFADTANLMNEWLRLGELLGLDLKGVNDTKKLSLIRQALTNQPIWTVILDNVEEQNSIKDLLPEKRTTEQRVLITTRSKNWGKWPIVPMGEFTAEEALHYCQQCLSSEQIVGADAMTKRLEYLPLALSHAVAYLQQTGINAKEYLDRYQKFGIELLQHDIKKKSSDKLYNYTVLTTWYISVKALEKRLPKAAEAVILCAYLAPENISTLFLQKALRLDELALDSCIIGIRDYDLLTRVGNNFKMHRLVQEAIRYQESIASPPTVTNQRIGLLVKMLYSVYPFEYMRAEDYEFSRALLPHLEAVLAHVELLPTGKTEIDSAAEWRANLLTAIGIFCKEVSGDTRKALKNFQEALEIYTKIYGENHGKISEVYNYLGATQYTLADAKSCQRYHEKALEIQKKIYEEEHSTVADTYKYLGNSCLLKHDSKSAQLFYEKSLQIRLKILGNKHPKVADCYNNLGMVYSNHKELKKALAFYEQAKLIYLETLGDTHPKSSLIHNNLGLLYRKLGDIPLTLDCFIKSNNICLKIYGNVHIDTALSFYNLGETYIHKKDFKPAITHLNKSLAIYTESCGPTHRRVIGNHQLLGKAHQAFTDSQSALSHYQQALTLSLKEYGDTPHECLADAYQAIGCLYDSLGDAKSARDYFQKTLDIAIRLYGDNHQLVALCYNNLGAICNDLEDAESALKNHNKAMAIFENLYGKKDINITISYRGLGEVYSKIGKKELAFDYYQKALVIRLRVYGAEHPDVSKCYQDLGDYYRVSGDAKLACSNYETSLSIRLKTDGEIHFDVGNIYNNLGIVKEILGDYKSARKCYNSAQEIYQSLNRQEDARRAAKCLTRLELTIGQASAPLYGSYWSSRQSSSDNKDAFEKDAIPAQKPTCIIS